MFYEKNEMVVNMFWARFSEKGVDIQLMPKDVTMPGFGGTDEKSKL